MTVDDTETKCPSVDIATQRPPNLLPPTKALSACSPLDVVWVGAIPGAAEEWCFRGGLLPAISPDWCEGGCTGTWGQCQLQWTCQLGQSNLWRAGLPKLPAPRQPLHPEQFVPTHRRGAAVTAIVFGLLHLLDRRRTPVSAAWATGVGAAYGALYLHTGNVADAALAHALSNVVSGLGYKLGGTQAPDTPS